MQATARLHEQDVKVRMFIKSLKASPDFHANFKKGCQWDVKYEIVKVMNFLLFWLDKDSL